MDQSKRPNYLDGLIFGGIIRSILSYSEWPEYGGGHISMGPAWREFILTLIVVLTFQVASGIPIHLIHLLRLGASRATCLGICLMVLVQQQETMATLL